MVWLLGFSAFTAGAWVQCLVKKLRSHKWHCESEVAQLCPILWDHTDCSLPGSSVHGIFQAGILEWGAISFSRSSAYNVGDPGQSLGQEDPLEQEMAPHSSILTWKIPWTEEPGGLQSMGSQRVGHD